MVGRAAPWVVAAASFLFATPVAARSEAVVRGKDQPHLRLDFGRDLGTAPLGRWRGPRLTALEKARLDGRRVLLGSSLAPTAALARLVAIALRRIPTSAEARARYDSWAAARGPDAVLPLSLAVARRFGICRERAFLIVRAATDAGLRARVRYGRVYDASTGQELQRDGGHSWAEVRLGGRWWMVDPSHPDGVVPVRRARTRERLPDGFVQTVEVRRAGSLLYAVTDRVELLSR
jgi:hypothetical protein